MKKAIVLLVVVAIVFCGLWIYEKNDKSELEQLCQINAAQAFDSFTEYKESGSDADYWYGVADFNAFMRAWLAVERETNPDYIYCNTVYGSMILTPEKVQSCIDELLIALEILGEDYTNPNGYLRMSELGNLLRYD